MPLTIGIDARFYRRETGGLGRYTRELLTHLARIDAKTRYRIFLTPEDLLEWQAPGSNFTPVVVPVRHYTLSEQTLFLKILMQEHVDLVHFLNFNHPLFYQGKFVTTLHDLTVYFHPIGRSAHARFRRAAFHALFKRSLTAATRVIAISEYTAEDAYQNLGIPHGKMDVIYEGGPNAYDPSPEERKQVRLYLKTDKPYFLFLSQWREHKGLLTLLKAFELSGTTTHSLVLAGGGRSADLQLVGAVAASPAHSQIVTPGFVPDELLPALYAEAAAFVMPSEYEGFGLPVLEAFAYGAPVIAARNSSIIEVGGSAAQFFDTGNVEELTSLLQGVIKTNGTVESGKKQLAMFSWEQTARQTLATYQRVLES